MLADELNGSMNHSSSGTFFSHNNGLEGEAVDSRLIKKKKNCLNTRCCCPRAPIDSYSFEHLFVVKQVTFAALDNTLMH